MKRADLGAIFRYRGDLVQVVAISDRKTLILHPLEKEPCPHCGDPGRMHIVEDSLIFQEHAKAVPSLEES